MRKINDGLSKYQRYYRRHKKECAVRTKKWHFENPECARESDRRRQHSPQRIANSKRYYLRHRKERLAYVKIYRIENIEKIRSYLNRPDVRHKKMKEIPKLSRFRFSVSRSGAKRRGLAWNISKSDYEELISKRCDYCDGVLSPYGSGLDRIDNSKGYIIGNVVPCCGTCNWNRCDNLTHEEMKVAMRAVLDFRLKKVLSGVI